MKGLGERDLAKFLQSLNVQGETSFYADGLGVDEDADNEGHRKALEEPSLLKVVNGNPGVLVRDVLFAHWDVGLRCILFLCFLFSTPSGECKNLNSELWVTKDQD